MGNHHGQTVFDEDVWWSCFAASNGSPILFRQLLVETCVQFHKTTHVSNAKTYTFPYCPTSVPVLLSLNFKVCGGFLCSHNMYVCIYQYVCTSWDSYRYTVHPELLKKSYKVIGSTVLYQFCTLRCSGLNESYSYTVGMLSTYSAILYIYSNPTSYCSTVYTFKANAKSTVNVSIYEFILYVRTRTLFTHS